MPFYDHAPADSEGVVVVKGVGGAERLSKWYRPSGVASQCNDMQRHAVYAAVL